MQKNNAKRKRTQDITYENETNQNCMMQDDVLEVGTSLSSDSLPVFFWFSSHEEALTFSLLCTVCAMASSTLWVRQGRCIASSLFSPRSRITVAALGPGGSNAKWTFLATVILLHFVFLDRSQGRCTVMFWGGGSGDES